jgi:hypothetical protein
MTTSATVASHLEIGLLENIAKAGEYELPQDSGNSETGLIPKHAGHEIQKKFLQVLISRRSTISWSEREPPKKKFPTQKSF